MPFLSGLVRSLLVGGLFSASSALLAPAMAAAGDAGFYRAQLAQPAAQSRTIVRGVVFACDGTSCRAPRAASHTQMMCVEVVRKLGPVAAFEAGGKPLDAAALAACNQPR